MVGGNIKCIRNRYALSCPFAGFHPNQNSADRHWQGGDRAGPVGNVLVINHAVTRDDDLTVRLVRHYATLTTMNPTTSVPLKATDASRLRIEITTEPAAVVTRPAITMPWLFVPLATLTITISAAAI